jgi:hypothetical protein
MTPVILTGGRGAGSAIDFVFIFVVVIVTAVVFIIAPPYARNAIEADSN